MAQEMTTRRENTGFLIVSYVILIAAGVVGLGFDPPAAVGIRAAIVALLVAIAAIQVRAPSSAGPCWKIRLHIGVHAAMVAALMFLQPGWTMHPALYMPPIVQAMLALPVREGPYWIAAFTVMTAVSFGIGISPSEGLIAMFLYGVLYAFIGAFAGALKRADAARRESQALAAELQMANEQLQDYALRAETMAVVEERNRLAREMHDTLGHHLTVAAVQLEAAQRLCPSDAERAAGLIGTVREQVHEALQELRATVATLRSPVEADLHLHSALRRLTAQFEEATGLTINRVLPETLPPLPDTHRLALYRAAQEALTNIQRHAGAQQVWLVLIAGDDSVTLLVSDDGRGLGRERAAGGFGLRGLRERAEMLGGALHVEPRAGGGTQLSFSVPLSREGSGG